ncbi:hypothetical protein [Dokdonia sinensis]|nr:hypothetical protein [Dokdonia sinensis]
MRYSQDNKQFQDVLEVVVLGICLLAAIIVCYEYFTIESFEDAQASFARSLDAWDRQLASTNP